MTYKIMFVLLAFVVTAKPTFPQEPITIFGIPFNQQLTIPECPWKIVRDYMSTDKKATKREYNNIHFSEVLCYMQYSNIGNPLADDRVNFVFPLLKKPSMGRLGGRITNGRLARVEIYTRGISAQASDFEILTKKFGQPATLRRPSVQNRMGASFDTIEAEWSLPDGVFVVYGSALTQIDSGIAIISTPEGNAAEMHAQDELKRRFGGADL